MNRQVINGGGVMVVGLVVSDRRSVGTRWEGSHPVLECEFRTRAYAFDGVSVVDLETGVKVWDGERAPWAYVSEIREDGKGKVWGMA